MKNLFILLSLAATLAASAADFPAVHASMSWTPVHSITNQTGDIRQARTAPAMASSVCSFVVILRSNSRNEMQVSVGRCVSSPMMWI